MTTSSPGSDRWNLHFRSQVTHESERACVIIAEAMLERALDSLLRARLVPATMPGDPFFDGHYAPASSFGAKIEVAHRIGLIPPNWAHDLHTIRTICSDFAHDVTRANFQDPSIRSRILDLNRSQGVVITAPKTRALYPEGPSGDFQVTVSWMLWALEDLQDRITPIKPAVHFVQPRNPELENPRLTIDTAG